MVKAIPTALEHATAILDALGKTGPRGTDAVDVSARTGLNIRTVYRHFAALSVLGMVVGIDGTKRYRLGPAITKLAQSTSDYLEFLRNAQSLTQQAGEQLGEYVHATVYDQGTVVTIVCADIKSELAQDSFFSDGSRRPAHVSASGKIFLSASKRAFRAYTLRPLHRFTEYTITDVHALEKECLQIRARGWAQDNQEFILGLTCLSVPVLGLQGQPVGALAISARQDTFSADRRKRLLDTLIPKAKDFTHIIGG